MDVFACACVRVSACIYMHSSVPKGLRLHDMTDSTHTCVRVPVRMNACSQHSTNHKPSLAGGVCEASTIHKLTLVCEFSSTMVNSDHARQS